MSTPLILDLDRVRIDPAWALRVPHALAQRRQVLPLAFFDGKLHVACTDPSDLTALDAVKRFTGQPIEVARVESAALQRALAKVYGDSPQTHLNPRVSSTKLMRVQLDKETEDAVPLSNNLLQSAILRQASDIHIEPSRDDVRVRMRVDGVLEDFQRLPASALAGLISRFKVLAGMDIAEKRSPQDGAFAYQNGGRHINLRAATMPTKYGERLTLRLLALQADSLTLDHLGFSPSALQLLEAVLDQPHGMILLTGPTGSGKSTTLYAALRKLISMANLNILTIEDPIEYELNGVSQTEVDTADKASFAKVLRSALRHDPDVLAIGEVRDRESLDVAVKASLTGHLVLSTLHTNSAPSAVTRLVDMGLEKYLLAATVRLCIAQRLVRKLCPHCRVPRLLTGPEAKTFGHPECEGKHAYEPAGCVYCAGRGFVGRSGIFELLPLSNSLALEHFSEGVLIESMRAQGLPLLANDAMAKVIDGTTTVREAMSAVVGV